MPVDPRGGDLDPARAHVFGSHHRLGGAGTPQKLLMAAGVDADQEIPGFAGADDQPLIDHEGSAAEHRHLPGQEIFSEQHSDPFDQGVLMRGHSPFTERRSKTSRVSAILPSRMVKYSTAGAVVKDSVWG